MRSRRRISSCCVKEPLGDVHTLQEQRRERRVADRERERDRLAGLLGGAEPLLGRVGRGRRSRPRMSAGPTIPAAISTMPRRWPQRRSSGRASSAKARASRRCPCAPALPHDGDRQVIRIAESLGERSLLARERLRPVGVAEVGGVSGDHVERHAAPLEIAGGGAQRERGVGVLDALLHADPAQEDRAREPRPAASSLARAGRERRARRRASRRRRGEWPVDVQYGSIAAASRSARSPSPIGDPVVERGSEVGELALQLVEGGAAAGHAHLRRQAFREREVVLGVRGGGRRPRPASGRARPRRTGARPRAAARAGGGPGPGSSPPVHRARRPARPSPPARRRSRRRRRTRRACGTPAARLDRAARSSIRASPGSCAGASGRRAARPPAAAARPQAAPRAAPARAARPVRPRARSRAEARRAGGTAPRPPARCCR